MVTMHDIAAKLADRTDQGQVPWKTAVGESSFSASFGNMSVLISSRGSSTDSLVRLSVLNEKGTEIDFAEYDGIFNKEHQQLRALYQSAKRIALGTDEKLSELMELLDATSLVSSPEKAGGRPERRA